MKRMNTRLIGFPGLTLIARLLLVLTTWQAVAMPVWAQTPAAAKSVPNPLVGGPAFRHALLEDIKRLDAERPIEVRTAKTDEAVESGRPNRSEIASATPKAGASAGFRRVASSRIVPPVPELPPPAPAPMMAPPVPGSPTLPAALRVPTAGGANGISTFINPGLGVPAPMSQPMPFPESMTPSPTPAAPAVSSAVKSKSTPKTKSSASKKSANQAPLVNAGADQTVVFATTKTVSLSGSAKDDGLPEGSTLTYAWSKVSGPGTVSFSGPASLATSATFGAAGRYKLKLSASDSELVGFAIVTVTLTAPNQPPSVNAGPDRSVVYPNPMALQGVVDDDGLPDGTLTALWSKISGPGDVSFANPNSPTTTATITQVGVYILQLTANDGDQSTSDQVTVTVTGDNTPPAANFTVEPSGIESVVSIPGNGNAARSWSPSLLVNGGAVHSYSSARAPGIPNRILNYAGDDWTTAGMTNEWVVIELAGGVAHTVAAVRLSSFDIDNHVYPGYVKDFEVWVSTTTTEASAFTKVLTAATNLNAKTETFVFPGGPVQAKYVKFVPLNNHNQLYTGISLGDLDVLTPDMLDFASSSSQFNGSSKAEAVIDEVATSSEWRSPSGVTTDQWIKLKLDGSLPRKVHGFKITPGFYPPKDFEVSVSTTTDDDSAFTTVLSGTLTNSNNVEQTFSLNASVNAKYVKFLWKNGYSADSLWVRTVKVLAGAEVGSTILQDPGHASIFSIDRALDADTQTGIWQSPDAAPNQKITLLAANADVTDIDRVLLEPDPSNPSGSPKDFDVQVSTTDFTDGSFSTVFSGTLLQSGGKQTFVFPRVASKYVRLVLKNNYGLTRFILKNFQVFSPNRGSLTARFTDQSTDADGSVAGYLWNFGDGATSTERHPVHAYAGEGTYTVRLTVTDNAGATNIKEHVYRAVAPTATGADFSYSPITLDERQNAEFFDTSSPILGGNTTRTWNFGNGTTVGRDVPSFLHSYQDNGTYTVTLTVGSGTGFSFSKSRQVIVRNVPPTVTQGGHSTLFWGQSWTPAATVGDVSLVDAASLTGRWEYGDGETLTIPNCTTANVNPSHAYARPGVYAPTLRVTDKDGDSGNASTTVAVVRHTTRLNFLAVDANLPGQPPILRAKLEDSVLNQPLAGKTVVFTANCVTASAVTGADGVAEVTIPLPNGATWTQSTATFAEEELYNGTVTVAGLPSVMPAGTPSHLGTDFRVMFPTNFYTVPIPPGVLELSLHISAETAASGTVSAPGAGFVQTFSVPAGQSVKVVVPAELIVQTSDTIENKGIRVTSDAPVAVYGLSGIASTSDSFLALPTSTLGTRYITNGYHNKGWASANDSEFGVVAVADGTQVTITPKTNAGGRLVNVPYTITLNQGQTYQLRSERLDTPNQGDLSGTLVTSDKPIAVFGAHRAVAVSPNEDKAYVDHILEQLPPVETWGRRFVTVPLALRQNGDIFRYLAAYDDTHVAVNGVEVAVLNRGEYFKHLLTTGSLILADKPILVCQYMTSHTFDPPPTGLADPSMIVVPPDNRFLSKYVVVNTVRAGLSTSFRHFLNLAVPNEAVGHIQLDGSDVPAGSFSPIGTSGFSGARIETTGGAHRLTGPSPFGVVVYGYYQGDAESYAHPGGMLLGNELCQSNLTLTPKTATAAAGTESCVTATLRNEQGLPVADASVSFTVTGPNARSETATTNAAGEARFCYSGANQGTDTITASVGTLSDTAFKLWVVAGANQPPVVSAGPDQTVFLGENLIKNPGNDAALVNNEIPDWVETSGGAWTQAPAGTGDFPGAHRGQSYFYAGETPSGELRQDIDLSAFVARIASGIQVFQFKGFVRNRAESPADTSSIVLETLGDTGSVLQSVTSPGTPTATGWTQTTINVTPVPGTTKIRVRLLSNRNSGQTNDGYFDSLSLQPLVVAGAKFDGQVTDDGLPSGLLSKQWTVVSKPFTGTVTFFNDNAPATSATFNQVGTYTLKLTANDSEFTTEDTTVITVAQATCAVALSPAALPNGNVGQAYTQALTATGGVAPYGFVLVSGVLPAGLTLSPTGTLSGTPTQPATFTFTIDATDAQGCGGTKQYTVTIDGVQCPPSIQVVPGTLPGASVGNPYSQTFTTTGATAPYTFALRTGALPAGLTLSPTGTLSGTPTAPGTFTFNLTVTDAQGCQYGVDDFSITVVTCQAITITPTSLPNGLTGVAYSRQLTASGGTAPHLFAVASGALPPGLNLSNGGTLNGVLTTAGTFTFTIRATDAQGCSGSVAHTVTVAQCPTITVAPASLADGQVGDAYFRQLTASGGASPYFFAVASGTLPAGVTLSGGGTLSGTPTAAGASSFTIRVSDAQGCQATIAYTLNVISCPAMTISPATLPSGLSGTAYSQTFTASGGTAPHTFALVNGFLPDGVTLSAGGTLSGTPTVSGNFSFILRATDAAGCAKTQTYTLTIGNCPQLMIGPASIPFGTVGAPYSLTLTATGGTAPYSFIVSSGVLPPGLTLAAGGVISGTPTQGGNYPVTVRAVDASGCASDASFSITVGTGVPLVVEITSPADGAEVTKPVPVVGTASGGNWTLEIAQNAEAETPGYTPTWTTLATGTTAVVNGTLGTIDPTLMLNGVYTLRLTVSDGVNASYVTSAVVLTRNMKIGHFTLSFSDLSVPMLGLPIEAVRTYDSRDKTVGDFGYGWRLTLKNIRVNKTVVPGRHWEEQVTVRYSIAGQEPTYRLVPKRSAQVTLTFPDGRVYRFAPSPRPTQSLTPIQFLNGIDWVPADSRTRGTLVPLTPSGDPYVIGSAFVQGTPPDPTYQLPTEVRVSDVEIVDATGAPVVYNPRRFRFTDEDGTTFLIDEQLGVREITDLNGTKVTITDAGIQHSDGLGAVFVRDAQGRITRITDPNGNAMTYAYDASGDLVSFTDRENQTTTFSYLTNPAHHLDKITDARGVTPIRNEYDASGRLTKHIDAFGKEIVYTHNIAGREEIVRDRLGNPTRFVYDDNGNVLEKTDAAGARTTYTYDGNDNELTVTNALGKTTTYTYDSRDNRLTETDPLGNVMRWTYNNLRQVLTFTDPKGNVTTNTFDVRGNLLTTTDALAKTTIYTYAPNSSAMTSVRDALGHTTTYTYGSFGRVAVKTNALGHPTTHTYDSNGNQLTISVTRTIPGGGIETLTTTQTYDKLNRVTKKTYPDGTFVETVYNPIGKISANKDQLGRQTTFAYDSMGQLSSTTYPDGSSSSSTYDAEDRRLTSTDQAGRTTSYEYDVVGRLRKMTYPDGTTTESTHDLLGRVLTTRDALGHVTTHEYDPNCGCSGRRTKVIDALGKFTTFAFDQNGNQTSMTDELGHTRTYTYDALNRRTRTTLHDGTYRETGYDDIGRHVSERDQAGQITRFAYDALGRLVKVTDALNHETTYGYDELGQQITQTDVLGRTTRYEYNRTGRRTKRVLPMGQFETYAYNTVGNLISRTDFNGKTTTFTFDNMNRLTAKTPDAGFGAQPITYTYTVLGQRASMTDASGVTTYTYDNRNRLTSKAMPNGTLSYTYNAVGNILTVRSSNADGLSVDYGYDALNRLTTVTDNRLGATNNVTAYTFDDIGNLKTVVLPNGVTSTYTYDALNRLTQLGTQDSALRTLASYAYTLGAAGNRLSVAELGGRTATYAYDALYRLTSETIAGAAQAVQNGQITYTYDAVGNRQSRTSTVAAVLAQTGITVDDNDRLTTDGYDNNGSTITSSGKIYVYNFENRLIAVNGSGSSMSIVYDGDGNRVSKSVTTGSTTVTTKYLVDTNNHTGYAQVVEELRGGSVSRQYTYGLDLINQQRTTDNGQRTTSFYGYDGHGSVRFLTDATGAKTDGYDFDAFGNLIGQTGTTPNLYLYAGEQWDADLGLYYNRARYLNAATGRFWSFDCYEGSKFDPSSLHKYLYSNNNSVNRNDPSGKYSLPGVLIAVSLLLISLSFTFYIFDLAEEDRIIQEHGDGPAFPAYGNYCGAGNAFPLSPIDDLDRCCLEHDDCYTKYEATFKLFGPITWDAAWCDCIFIGCAKEADCHYDFLCYIEKIGISIIFGSRCDMIKIIF